MPDHDEGLQRFLDSVAGHRLLTAREELELARRYRAGDDSARLKLIEHNQRLVISIARYYRGRGSISEYADLIQDGNLGLDRAARKFDPGRGYRFSTYASLWIKQAIQRGLSSSDSAIRLPAQVAERRAKARARMLRDPDVALDEIARDMDVDAVALERALGAASVVTSLDRVVADDDEARQTLIDCVPDLHADDPQDIPEDSAPLREAMRDLTPLQQDVLRLRFGFDGEALSLAEIAERLACSVGTVQSAQRTALEALRGTLE